MAELKELVEYLDRYLRVAEIPDYAGAYNGLQVASRSPVDRIAAAVDACQETIEAAVGQGAQLLVVHHGLFWGDPLPVTGRSYRRLRALFEADLAVYSAHLPLDVHPRVGNNVLLAGALGFPVEGRFGTHEGLEGLGVWTAADLPREKLAERLETACGAPPVVVPGGPAHVRRLGIVTGAAASLLPQARAEGLDTFITGEGSHHTYHDAMEWGMNLVYAGHYATETFGVRALAGHLAEEYGLEWSFLDNPTGL
jgi:dinuclear metal center YbgI/SA1388 family protein